MKTRTRTEAPIWTGRKRSTWYATAGLVMLALIGGGLVALDRYRSAIDDQPATLALQWRACEDGLECATARVPLDYDSPRGARIDLALVRRPAGDPGSRVGSLFLNPGGPGASGVDLVRQIGHLLPPPLQERFDIVGFDPRGVARSTPLNCLTGPDVAANALPPFPFPVTRQEELAKEAGARELAKACAERAGHLIDHMATANVARDLDLLRASVGDERLHYMGWSYGSQLGTTYANLFPHRVGAVVLDGVLDPVAWTTGSGDAATVPFSIRIGSARGARDALAEFFRLCDEAGPTCAFSGRAEARFAALADRLRAAPILAPGVDGTRVAFTYADLIELTRHVLTFPDEWPRHAALLGDLERGSPGNDRWARVAGVLDRVEGDLEAKRQQLQNMAEIQQAVACADGDNPSSFAAWAAAASASEAAHGYFGRFYSWDSSACAVWRGRDRDRYVGPWDAKTANPVLVIGTLVDPATPYEGAVKVSQLLPNSRLLTYAGWGHGAFHQRSECIARAVIEYLISGSPPAHGTVCPANPSPFLQPPDPRRPSAPRS